MKRILVLLLLASCSEDDSPVFRIEDPFFESRFEKFVEVASVFEVTITRNNMILRFVNEGNTQTNDSRSYTKDGQLYIDIDKGFLDANGQYEDQVEMVLFQQLANGLLDTPFRDCGIMKKVTTAGDYPISPSWDYGDYPVLFDTEAPC